MDQKKGLFFLHNEEVYPGCDDDDDDNGKDYHRGGQPLGGRHLTGGRRHHGLDRRRRCYRFGEERVNTEVRYRCSYCSGLRREGRLDILPVAGLRVVPFHRELLGGKVERIPEIIGDIEGQGDRGVERGSVGACLISEAGELEERSGRDSRYHIRCCGLDGDLRQGFAVPVERRHALRHEEACDPVGSGDSGGVAHDTIGAGGQAAGSHALSRGGSRGLTAAAAAAAEAGVGGLRCRRCGGHGDGLLIDRNDLVTLHAHGVERIGPGVEFLEGCRRNGHRGCTRISGAPVAFGDGESGVCVDVGRDTVHGQGVGDRGCTACDCLEDLNNICSRDRDGLFGEFRRVDRHREAVSRPVLDQGVGDRVHAGEGDGYVLVLVLVVGVIPVPSGGLLPVEDGDRHGGKDMHRRRGVVILHRRDEVLPGLRPRVGPCIHHAPCEAAVRCESGEVDLILLQREVEIVLVVVFAVDSAPGCEPRLVHVDDGIALEEVAFLRCGLEEFGECGARGKVGRYLKQEDVAGLSGNVHGEARDRLFDVEPVLTRDGAPVDRLSRFVCSHLHTVVVAAHRVERADDVPEERVLEL